MLASNGVGEKLGGPPIVARDLGANFNHLDRVAGFYAGVSSGLHLDCNKAAVYPTMSPRSLAWFIMGSN